MRFLPILFIVVSFLGTSCRVVAQENNTNLCYTETIKQEKQKGIQRHLLSAIATVESGKWNKNYKANIAHPWTVMAEGKGRYLPNKQQAIAEVLRLKAKGVKNIDVGCMQVNLMWHPDAFNSLEEAFDPKINVSYAADFVKRLYKAHNSWAKATTHYHSSLPSKAAKYRKRIIKVLKTIKTSIADKKWFKGEKPHRLASLPKTEQSKRETARKSADEWRRKKLAAYNKRKRLKNKSDS
ncbi:MAG: transglycosylase SLT domain-containing protein [Alphaproteobacteria bacterium]|nr:transglycosylase SLT domain-containing protein [Alphaproteobacteria bacterium]